MCCIICYLNDSRAYLQFDIDIYEQGSETVQVVPTYPSPVYTRLFLMKLLLNEHISVHTIVTSDSEHCSLRLSKSQLDYEVM